MIISRSIYVALQVFLASSSPILENQILLAELTLTRTCISIQHFLSVVDLIKPWDFIRPVTMYKPSAFSLLQVSSYPLHCFSPLSASKVENISLHVLYYLNIPCVVQLVKNLPAMQETLVWFLGWENPFEKEMATHSSILAWRIPWTEGPGGLQSMGSQELDRTW